MPPIPTATAQHGYFPARYTAEYLEEYVEREIGGKTLRERIWFGAWAEGVEKRGDEGWTVTVLRERGKVLVHAKKLVVAVGATSVPSMPKLKGLEGFGGRVLHCRDLALWEREEMASDRKDRSRGCTTPSKPRQVVVLGGGKSLQLTLVFRLCCSANPSSPFLSQPARQPMPS